jgi:polyisoprenoid-binding protein YceI
MDRKAYSALKVTAFPEIKFTSISAIGISPDNNKFRDNLAGNLFIAGKSVPVSIPLTGALSNINGTNKIDVSGEIELKMSDFDITPPTAMLGTLKTGDKVKVLFSFQFLMKSVN